nr:MAG TPA: DNA polymerase III subunit alpha [Caudoviricetes sp.]
MGNATFQAIPFSGTEELTDYIVLDLETTGLSPSSCQIIQLAAVHFVDHREAACFSTYIDPRCHIPAAVTRLTGISDETVTGAPFIEDVFMDFVRFLWKAPFVTGWNVSFDLGFLSAVIGEDISTYFRPFDTMALYGRSVGRPRCRLSDACDAIGFAASFHDALDDCRACGAVLSWLCQGNRMDHAFHSREERQAALGSYLARASSGECPVSVGDVRRGGALDGKSVVFTGALSFARSAAKALAQAAGAAVKTAVSRKTDFLVVGEQDEVLVGCDGMSEKEEKAAALNQQGASISVISEKQFLEMLQM